MRRASMGRAIGWSWWKSVIGRKVIADSLAMLTSKTAPQSYREHGNEKPDPRSPRGGLSPVGQRPVHAVGTQFPWKPFGTRSGRRTVPTVSSVPASSRTRSLRCSDAW